MRHSAALLATVTLAAAGSARAQAPGVPLYAGAFIPTATVSGSVAFPGAESVVGSGTVWALSGAFVTGRFGVSGTLGTFDSSDGPARTTYGALATFKVIGGPLTPLAIYLGAGAGGVNEGIPDYAEIVFPLLASASLTIPTPVISLRPWIAPRYDIIAVSETTGDLPTADSDGRVAVSGGIDFTLFRGPSLHLLSEWVDGFDPIIGLGLSLRF